MSQLTPHQIDALNTKRSISLTANAGSGKTYVLAKRYLEVILNTDTSIHKIAAITFTEKAAGELYKRIADELNKLSKQKTLQTVQKKIDRLRKQLVSANISTIHSFCVDILREFPVEASLDANFIPIDQRTATELSELSIEYIIRRKLSATNKDSDAKLLIRLLGSKRALARELEQVVQKRKTLFSIKGSYYKKSIKEIAISLSSLFENDITDILNVELPDALYNLRIINDEVLRKDIENEIGIQVKNILEKISRDSNKKKNLLQLAELRDLVCTKQGKIKLRGYLKNDTSDELNTSIINVERFFKAFENLIYAQESFDTEKELSLYAKALLNISLDVIDEYENKKSQMGYLDFEDILLKTNEIIGREEVRNAINRKYKYLLVDEYQDTNEIQYEIFLPIVNNLKSGNLFIVGDEKQSIYRFRDAELEVFGKTKEDIKRASDSNLILTLPDSFRMAPCICLFTNYLFKNLFKKPQKLYNEVEHSDLVCARTDSFKGGVEFLVSKGNEKYLEAELIAKRILKLKSECNTEVPNWSDMAVLVRKRSAFDELEKTFIKFDIPFTVVGGKGFYQQQSISDIYNYFAFLFNEKDDATLIGTLRSPFKVSDTQIFQLSIFPGISFWEKLINGASSNEFWKQIYLTISENLNLAKRISIPALLRNILNESGFIATISSRVNGKQEINNLKKLISMTIKFFNQDFNSFYDYLSFLKNSISNYSEESQAGIEAENNCVNMMTIHQAKGLEYPAVFLFRCSDAIQSGNVTAKSFKIDKKYGLLTKVPHDKNFFGQYYSAPIVELFNFIEGRKTTAELKRLLYVGVTRAKYFLFLSMTEANERVNRLNSFANLLMEGLNLNFTEKDFTLTGDLEFLQHKDNEFKTVKRQMNIKIPIIKNVDLLEKQRDESTQKDLIRNCSLNAVKDNSKGEIISATKYSVFSNCPRKFSLTYNYNLGSSIKDLKLLKNISYHRHNYEFNSNEQKKINFEEPNVQTSEYADIKGKVIHQILKVDIPQSNIENSIIYFLSNEISSFKKTQENINEFETAILQNMYKFYNSKEYKILKAYHNYKNEFEVYYKQADYYLFGIIDKVIFTENRIIVVDYKTDNIQESEVNIRAEKYIQQLKFYSYLLTKLYDDISELEMRIIFIKFPDLPFVKIFKKNDENEVRLGIEKMIASIRNNNYSVNLEHCSRCIFAVHNDECILGNDDKNALTNN